MSKWKKGKQEIKRYYDLQLKRSTDFKAFLFGILLTLIVLLPIILVIIQLFKTYIYHPYLRFGLVLLGWFMIMFANGLSNMFMVKIAKAYYPENPNLTNIDEKAILVHQTFNIGFALFTILILIVLGVL